MWTRLTDHVKEQVSSWWPFTTTWMTVLLQQTRFFSVWFRRLLPSPVPLPARNVIRPCEKDASPAMPLALSGMAELMFAEGMSVWWRWPTSFSYFFFSFTFCLSPKRNHPWCNYWRRTLAKILFAHCFQLLERFWHVCHTYFEISVENVDVSHGFLVISLYVATK